MEETRDKHKERLNLMDINLRLLNITGIIPNKRIYSSLWKCRLYRFCQFLSYVLYTVVLILQVLGLYHYWGDMVIITDNIAVTTTFMVGYIPAGFTIMKSYKIHKVIDYLETDSIFSFRMIRSNNKYTKIIHEAKTLASHLTLFTIISLLTTIFFWTIYPLVLLMFRNGHAITQHAESLRAKFQYFVFVMWIPSEEPHSYLYATIYFVQVITFSMSLIYLIGLIPLYLSLIIYTTAQFKVVCAAINEIDEVASTVSYRQEYNRVRGFLKSKIGFVEKFNSFVRPTTLLSDVQWEWENKSRGKAFENIVFPLGIVKQHHATSTSIRTPEVSTTNNSVADSTISMMVECIKLHQSAIR